ncbi:MAG: hypothetical protein ACI35O_01130 [Bacillaceae bacterium]
MEWETLPSWFWAIYYLFLFITLGTAIVNIFREKMIVLSIIVIMMTIITPLVSLFNGIGRGEGLNEFEHFVYELQQGASWSIIVMIGYLYIFIRWVLFFSKKRRRAS